VKQRAKSLGFDVVGVARAGALGDDFQRYERFVERGFQGDMAWLAESREARHRTDGESILAGARSVVCVAGSYKRSAEDEARDPPLARMIARYARGHDYHNGLRRKLRQLAVYIRTLGDGVEARPLCDDAPILERAWASRAGIGFVGKNGLVIVPGVGSFVLLGEVVTTLDLEPDEPITERCGSCTRCLSACPTSAFASPFVLDPRRCISYLTIEHRGPIDASLREGIGEHLFGCDDCQTVCPFNRSERGTTGSHRYDPLDRWSKTTLEQLVEDGDVGDGTPLKRATPEGLSRNAAIVLGNRGEGQEALERAAERHPSRVVREAARWAASSFRGKAAR
jgi:epoxyqueuosine reductase